MKKTYIAATVMSLTCGTYAFYSSGTLALATVLSTCGIGIAIAKLHKQQEKRDAKINNILNKVEDAFKNQEQLREELELVSQGEEKMSMEDIKGHTTALKEAKNKLEETVRNFNNSGQDRLIRHGIAGAFGTYALFHGGVGPLILFSSTYLAGNSIIKTIEKNDKMNELLTNLGDFNKKQERVIENLKIVSAKNKTLMGDMIRDIEVQKEAGEQAKSNGLEQRGSEKGEKGYDLKKLKKAALTFGLIALAAGGGHLFYAHGIMESTLYLGACFIGNEIRNVLSRNKNVNAKLKDILNDVKSFIKTEGRVIEELNKMPPGREKTSLQEISRELNVADRGNTADRGESPKKVMDGREVKAFK